MPSNLTLILTLSRVSNLPTVWTNCLAAWSINQSVENLVGLAPFWHMPVSLDWGIFGWVLVGASFVYSGGCVLNDAFDQKFDQEYNPHRPIPSGKIKASTVWTVGILFLLIGGSVLVGVASCSLPLVGSLLGAVCLYDLVHKKWSGSVWVMGSCRTFLWLAAASAGGMEIMDPVLVGSLCIGMYVVGISLFARNEAKKNESRTFGRLAILLLLAPCILTLGSFTMWNQLDSTTILLLNFTGLYLGWIIFRAIVTMTNAREDEAIGRGVSILLAGICAVDALAICVFIPTLVASCLLAQFFAHILQKKFAAT